MRVNASRFDRPWVKRESGIVGDGLMDLAVVS